MGEVDVLLVASFLGTEPEPDLDGYRTTGLLVVGASTAAVDIRRNTVVSVRDMEAASSLVACRHSYNLDHVDPVHSTGSRNNLTFSDCLERQCFVAGAPSSSFSRVTGG